MNKCSIASPAWASGGCANCDQMSKDISDADHMSLRAQNTDCIARQGPGPATKHRQEPRERPFSTVFTSTVVPRPHQRRWSADFCKNETSSVIIVRKNKKEPQPPQRSVSIPQRNPASHPSFKRYSCPPTGVFSSPRHSYSSSSSSSTTSCTSPPPVRTSVITGHDPLGWKLRPKSSSASRRARTNRLSLQIPLPVIFPDPKTSPGPQSDNLVKPPLRPKPPRRHSDSSAFLRYLATPLPAVTLDELCAVHLRRVSLSDESDDVFSGGKEEVVTTQPRKKPPPVPEKTSTARQMAQLIARSHQRYKTNEENIYASVIKPKPKPSCQTDDCSSQHGRKTAGLQVDTSCDRGRSTPHWLAKETERRDLRLL